MIFFTIIEATKGKRTKLLSRNIFSKVPSRNVIIKSTNASLLPSGTKKTVQLASTAFSNNSSSSSTTNSNSNSKISSSSNSVSPISNSNFNSTILGSNVYSCPIKNNKPPVNFDPMEKQTKLNIKSIVNNYSLNTNNTVKIKLVNKLPLNSGYSDTLKDIEIQPQKNPEDSVLQGDIENPNNFFFSIQNRPTKLQDVENVSTILTTEDFCGIQILPGSDFLTQLQNIKAFSGVCDIQTNGERHIFIGTVRETFKDGSIKIFGSFFSSNTIVNIGNNYEYLIECSERILGSDVKLQGFSVPKEYILKQGWTFVLKFTLNPKTLAEGISIVIQEENNPNSVNHLTDPQKIYQKTLDQAQRIEKALADKASALGLVENLVSKYQSPFGNGNSGNGNGNGNGNLPPI